MKLIGNLKDKVDKAKTMEAKKDIIAEAGMELADDELEGVVGGIDYKTYLKKRKKEMGNPVYDMEKPIYKMKTSKSNVEETNMRVGQTIKDMNNEMSNQFK